MKLVAEKNDCCDFIANAGDGLIYLAVKNPSPPPGVSITSFADTPSLYSTLAEQYRFSKSNKRIVFFGGFERADAMARSLMSEFNRQPKAPGTIMSRLKNLASLINQPKSQVNSITVLGYGREKKLNSLQINLDTEFTLDAQVRATESLFAPINLNNTRVQEIVNSDLTLQLPIRWQKSAKQGKLAIIKFSYTELGKFGKPNDVFISSESSQSEQVTKLRSKMVNATKNALESRTDNAPITIDTLIKIREEIEEELKQLPNEQLVEMLLKRGQDTYYITNRFGQS